MTIEVFCRHQNKASPGRKSCASVEVDQSTQSSTADLLVSSPSNITKKRTRYFCVRARIVRPDGKANAKTVHWLNRAWQRHRMRSLKTAAIVFFLTPTMPRSRARRDTAAASEVRWRWSGKVRHPFPGQISSPSEQAQHPRPRSSVPRRLDTPTPQGSCRVGIVKA